MIDQKKQKLITKISDKLNTLPKEEILPFFLAVQKKCKEENINFTNEELQEFLASFEAHASETEKKQLRLIKEFMNP